MCTQCTLQLPETNTFYKQCILGVIIIIWLKKMTVIKLCFIFYHLMFYCYLFLKLPHEMFSFSSEILCCVSGYQTKAYKSISFIFKLLKIKLFLANKGNLLLKLKHVRNVVVVIMLVRNRIADIFCFMFFILCSVSSFYRLQIRGSV